MTLQQQSNSAQRVQEEMTRMASQVTQHQRTIWLLAKAAGGKVVIDESETNPLWEVKFERPNPKAPTLIVIAAAMPEATDEQLLSLAKRLIGTKKDPRDEAINVGLVDYPIQYLMGRLSNFAVWHEKQWLNRTEFDALKMKGPSDGYNPLPPS